jgi:hypothetical protein
MKNKFPGYYRPTTEEFRSLWTSCTFFVDANVLLNMYGYSESTREQLLTILETISDRLRIPYQFALEYQRNRARAIMQQVRNYVQVEKTLRDVYEKEFEPKLKHPFLSNKMQERFNDIRSGLKEGRERVEALFSSDPYHDRITQALAGHVGDPPDTKKLKDLYKRATERYTAEIPPGYEDMKEKGEPDAYGDYIGWAQLLEMAKSEDKGAILITDDSKADWWQIQRDRTIGPRPELLAEFLTEVNQQFYMYGSAQFMKYSAEYLKSKVEDDAIQEISRRLEEKRRAASEKKPEPDKTELDIKSMPPSPDTRPAPSKPDFDQSSDKEPPVNTEKS